MESEGKKDEVRGEGGIYVPEKAATGDARALSPIRGTPNPAGRTPTFDLLLLTLLNSSFINTNS